jgi:hypothetical protein
VAEMLKLKCSRLVVVLWPLRLVLKCAEMTKMSRVMLIILF